MGVTSNASGIKPGTVAYFAASTPPAGWLKANGALISRTVYAALFNAIGTNFGVGDGATNFNVPDLRGEFVRGWDDGRGVDVGRGLGQTQTDEIKSHWHSQDTYSGGVGGANSLIGYTNTTYQGAVNGNATGGAETRPRNVALLACIKF